METPMDLEPPKTPTNLKSSTNRDLSSQVLRYRRQLEVGCGRLNCDSLFCHSNPGLKKYQLSGKELSMLAMKLALKHKNTDTFICPTTTTSTKAETPFLDQEKLEAAFQEARTTNSFTPVIRLLGRVFSEPDSLGLSFLKSPIATEIDGTDMGLDFTQIAQTYKLIFDPTTPENVQNVVTSSIERLFNDLKRNKSRADPLTQLRLYTILLENPKNVGLKYQQQTSLMYHLIFELSPPTFQLLEKNFVGRLYRPQNSRQTRLCEAGTDGKSLPDMNRDEIDISKDTGIVSATKFLKLLWDVNKKTHWIEEEQFYNQVLNENLFLKIDFVHWRGLNGTKYVAQSPMMPKTDMPHRDRFSFCFYPFILNPETKSQVLNIESLLNQRKLQNESLSLIHQGIMDMPFLVFSIRRDKLLEDSLDTIAATKLNDPGDLKKQLRVKFAGEEGVDVGGVKKEWFQLLVADLFSPNWGMFLPDEDTKTYWFNSKSTDFAQYELLGTVMGLAIYNGVILDLKFPTYVYKRLLDDSFDKIDVAEVYPAIEAGLSKLEAYQGDAEDFDLTFSHTFQYLEQTITHPLIPNGENVTVTNENKKLYLDTYRHYLLIDSIKSQLQAFVQGFKLVCDGEAIKLFTPKELQLLICGSPNLNFEDLEKGTSYDSGYDRNHPTIRAFWEVVHAFPLELKKQLLFFASGSDRAPIGGLSKMNLIITMHGEDSNRLPTAQTCFNHLFLPPYSSKDKLKDLLEKAIVNSTYFGLI